MRRPVAVLAVLGMVVAGCGTGAQLSQAVLDQARLQGVAPDLIYAVELEGYELVEQSVGGVNEEGFGAFYVSPAGSRVELRVDRGRFGDGLCVDTMLKDAEPQTAPVTCERDEVGWYRVGGGRHEYTAVRGDLPTVGDGAPHNPVGPGG
ncbi:hypothetical protein [Nonomuraea sp. NPDC046570]|uniref:hypothetical protein n=1 Tax=Nonomuraea sp. NPDC046570 TaxID=3155255 RepID=UPI003402889F